MEMRRFSVRLLRQALRPARVVRAEGTCHYTRTAAFHISVLRWRGLVNFLTPMRSPNIPAWQLPLRWDLRAGDTRGARRGKAVACFARWIRLSLLYKSRGESVNAITLSDARASLPSFQVFQL